MQIDAQGWDNIQSRSMEIPQKVFIEREGPYYTYSEDAPAGLSSRIDNIINGQYGRQNFITLFYCLPEIFAPVNEIASRVADASWLLKKDWNDETDWKDKDFNRLFSRPNPLMAFKQFVWQAVCYELLTGANYQYFNLPSTLSPDYRNILSWFNLPTHKVNVDKKKNVDPYSATEINDFINHYSIGKRQFDIQNVLPIVNHDLACGNDVDSFRSPLTGAHLAIKNLLPVYEARGVIYIKRGALGFLVSAKSDDSGRISLTKTEKEESQKEFQNTYGLRGDKHQVGVSSAPVDFIKTSMSIQELQPFDETLADAVAIYKVLRVPRHLVPSKDNSTFANADADMKSFYNDVIEPMAKRYAESWTNYLKIDRRYIMADFSHISVLQENRKEKSEVDRTNGTVWLQRWQNGACTLNEWITANDGTKGSGPIYEKTIFQLTPEELELVKNAINLKSNGQKDPAATEDQGTEAEGGANKLQ